MTWERLLAVVAVAAGAGIGILAPQLSRGESKAVFLVGFGAAFLVWLLGRALVSVFRRRQLKRAAERGDLDREELKQHARRVFQAVVGTLLSEPVEERDLLVSERFRTKLRDGTEPVIPPSVLHAKIERTGEEVRLRGVDPDADPPVYTARIDWMFVVPPGRGSVIVTQDWRFALNGAGTWILDRVEMVETVAV